MKRSVLRTLARLTARPLAMPPSTTADFRQQTALAFLCRRAGETPAGVATFHKTASGAWASTTWSALWDEVRRAAKAFGELGLRPGDRLAIMARTRREWQVAEMGATLAGAAVVGIDPQAASDQVVWILEHANASGLVVDSSEQLAKIPPTLRDRLRFALRLDEEPDRSTMTGLRSWQDAVAMQKVLPLEFTATPSSDTPAMLIYTSGTTGRPKGIEYTHGQLTVACQAMIREFPDLGRPNRLICWLPMAALFQRMINQVALAGGSMTYFVEDPREIMTRIADVRPTLFFSVPRFYEKLHDGIQEQLAKQSGIRKLVARTALAVGARWSQSIRSGRPPGWWLRLRYKLLDRLVLGRIRGSMGGEMKWMISGSAAAPTWLLAFFHSIGLLVLEAYGISENPVPIAANRPDAYRFGSVGRPFTPNQVRLGEDDEVLVKGPALFQGYAGEGPAADLFTPDGYYRTGDYGRFDADGFLYLTGRTGEIIKTSTGRRISPVMIEAVYRQSRYIDQIVVVGNNRTHLVALVGLNVQAVQAAVGRAAAQPIPGAELARSPFVIDLIERDLAVFGEKLARHEQIRAFAILPAPLSVANDELTPTLKLRRDRIEARYAETIQEIYSAAGKDAGR